MKEMLLIWRWFGSPCILRALLSGYNPLMVSSTILLVAARLLVFRAGPSTDGACSLLLLTATPFRGLPFGLLGATLTTTLDDGEKEEKDEKC